MWNTKLCLNLSAQQPMPLTEQLELYKKTGFDGFFPVWTPDMDLQALRSHADRIGMYFQSVHAPFVGINHLWEPSERTEEILNTQLACLAATAEAGVDLMVCHAFIGFRKHEPTEFGIRNFRILVDAAEAAGIRLAFENTEGEEYLTALMEAFRDRPHVGFCWDTGHEMCYNHSKDLLALYGDRLFCTHLNDNLGIRDSGGSITFHDDLHLLPFDGIADWQDIGARLARCGYQDCLTFELKPQTTLNGCTYPIYGHLDFEGYVTQSYIRAARVAAAYLRAAEKL